MGSRVSESLNLNEFKILIDFIEVDYVSFDDKIMEKEFIDSDREQNVVKLELENCIMKDATFRIWRFKFKRI